MTPEKHTEPRNFAEWFKGQSGKGLRFIALKEHTEPRFYATEPPKPTEHPCPFCEAEKKQPTRG